MSTPAEENKQPVAQQPALNLLSDVPSLHNILKSAAAQLMSHGQTVQELLKANMDLRAALHLSQNDNSQLAAQIQHLLSAHAPAIDVEFVQSQARHIDAGALQERPADKVPSGAGGPSGREHLDGTPGGASPLATDDGRPQVQL